MTLNLILASQSPRRCELLQLLGIPFTATAANADENSITEPDPAINVVQTARLKADLIANRLENLQAGTLILAADTTVAYGNKMLNKPANDEEAWQMLQRLRNKSHAVHTGVVLLELAGRRVWQGVSTAVVTMRNFSDAEIEAYVTSGDPLDKAGAYAIQHPIFRPVAQLRGCYCNVMGLPICDLIIALEKFVEATSFTRNQVDLTAVEQAHHHYACPTLRRMLHQ